MTLSLERHVTSHEGTLDYYVHTVARITYGCIFQTVSLSKWHMTTHFKFVKTVYNGSWNEL